MFPSNPKIFRRSPYSNLESTKQYRDISAVVVCKKHFPKSATQGRCALLADFGKCSYEATQSVYPDTAKK